MIRLVFCLLAVFGMYFGLISFAPQLFSKTFVFPLTTYVMSYATLILSVTAVFALTRLSIK